MAVLGIACLPRGAADAARADASSREIAAPRLTAADTGSQVRVGTEGFPLAGWELVWDDAANGSITQFRFAQVAGGANLACEGAFGARAALFEKVWGTERGTYWLSGLFGRTAGACELVEATPVRARVRQTVTANDALPGETPASLDVSYTVYATGRLYIEVEWAVGESPVTGTAPYADNSYRFTLADRGFLLGGEDAPALVAQLDNGLGGLPQLLFAASPVFWENGVPRSLANPATREQYLAPGAGFGRFTDPFLGMAGARLNAASAEGGPCEPGDVFRHLFLVDWSRSGPGTLADARVSAADFTRPDPLDGRPGAGRILAGRALAAEPAGPQGEAWVESEGCYAFQAAGNALCVELARARGGGAAVPFRMPAIKLRGFAVAHDSVRVFVFPGPGANQRALEPGVDYLLTSHADEAALGAGTRILTFFRDLPFGTNEEVTLWVVESAGALAAMRFEGPELRPQAGGVNLRWTCRDRGRYSGYVVSRALEPGGTWNRVSAAPVPDRTLEGNLIHSWTDLTVRPGWSYRYRLEAARRDGGPAEIFTAPAAIQAEPPGLPREGSGPAMAAWPNPAAAGAGTLLTYEAPSLEGGVAGSAGEPRLEIYTATGRRVRTLAAPAAGDGPRTVAWDGRDENGAPVVPGVYFARMRSGGTLVSRKLILTGGMPAN